MKFNTPVTTAMVLVLAVSAFGCGGAKSPAPVDEASQSQTDDVSEQIEAAGIDPEEYAKQSQPPQ